MHVHARAALVQANVVGRNMWEGVRWARMGALRGDANELAVRPKMVYMVVEARVVGALQLDLEAAAQARQASQGNPRTYIWC